MFVYSSSTRGWANIAGQDDQRPKQLQAANPAESLDCLASVLRAERTGAGELDGSAGAADSSLSSGGRSLGSPSSLAVRAAVHCATCQRCTYCTYSLW